ncbi:MAG: hypothetical protein U1E70_07115 [Acetobacteraceae bacterium]|nr:hypothetical protein [Pseudomonadota bacterium]
MSEIDEISARLTAMETVVGQLITHLAVRADDPAQWVTTRRVLAVHALDHHRAAQGAQRARVLAAILGLFDQAETVAADYVQP